MGSITLGKRYQCAECGGSLLCSKAGEGPLECCGQPMELAETKKLPSAD